MKLSRIFPYIVITVLALLLSLQNCSSEEESNTITIPEKKGSVVIEKPEPIIRYDTIYKDSIIEKVVKVENPVNQELLKKYQEAQDSLQRIKLFKDAITERRYEEEFNQDGVTVTVNSDVIGTLKRQEVSFLIPEQQINYKNPSEGLYLGAGVGVSHRSLQLPEPEINLSFLKNKSMYSIGVGTDKVRLTYKRKIF